MLGHESAEGEGFVLGGDGHVTGAFMGVLQII
jgi:hypothetical protein